MWIQFQAKAFSRKAHLLRVYMKVPNLTNSKIAASMSSCHDYESMLNEVDTNVPRNFNFARDVIDKHAENPELQNKVAFYYVSNKEQITKWSFSKLSDETKIYADALRSLGTIRRSLLILPKVPEWWILNVSAIRNNTTLLPVNVYARLLITILLKICQIIQKSKSK